MRVLHAAPHIDPYWGGPPVALAGLARAQVRAGVDVEIVATYHRTEQLDVADDLRALGIDVQMVGPGLSPLLWHPSLSRLMERAARRADVVHIHSMWTEVQHTAARAARRCGKPYVLCPCGTLASWSLAQSRLRKKIHLAWRGHAQLNAAAAVHYTTEQERAQNPIPAKAPAIVEPNGISLEEFADLPPKGTFRQRFPELSDHKILLFLGRVHKNKGLDVLIPAFAELAGEARLVIAGPDAGYGGRVRELVHRFAVDRRVLFTGMLRGSDRIAALVDADLFVLPSLYESFGIAVLEAMAAATPVVVTSQVNLHELITQYRLGEVLPLDPAALAHALRCWLADASRRRAAGARAREIALGQYDWRQIAERWTGHYLRLLDAH